jgi:replicative DNA helicase
MTLGTDTQLLLDHLHRGGVMGYWWTLESRQSSWWETGSRTPLPGGRRNVYFGVHPTTAIPPKNARGEPKPPAEVRAQLGCIAAINCLFAEYDAKDFADDKSAAYAKVESLDPPPSAVVDSGGGYHLYWLLDSPFLLASADDRERARKLQAAWVRLVDSDPQSKDLARVLRVPGTQNYKYTPPRPVEIVRADFDRLYAIDELAALAQPFLESDPTSAAHTNGAGDLSAWLTKALAGEIAKVASSFDGRKHERLLDSAIALGGLVHLGLTEQSIEKGLYAAIEGRALDTKGARKTIQDGISYGKLKPRKAPEPQPTKNTTATAQTDGQWGALIPFHTLDLPPFPTEIFPDWLRAFVEALTENMQTPPDLAGMLALATLAACCHGSIMVEAWEGWREPVNLYTVTSLPPGSRKSPVFRAMTAPLVAYEQELTQRTALMIASRAAEKDVLDQRLDHYKREASKAKSSGERASAMETVDELAAEAANFRIPAMPRLIVDDVTPEALASILAEQKGRIAALSSEGDIFAIMAGRYSSGTPNIGVYLRAHAGDPIRVDRRTRSEYIRQPALTIGITTQPDVLHNFGQTSAFRGQGLLGRFFYALPQSTVGHRAIVTPPVPPEVQQAYHQTIGALIGYVKELAAHGHSVNSVNSVVDPNDYGDSVNNNNNTDLDLYIYILTLSTEAQSLLIAWLEWLEPLMGEHGALSSMRDWASKLGGAILRVAGLLYLAKVARHNRHNRHNTLTIDAVTLNDAITLAQYLLPHALAAYAEIGADPAVAASRRVIRWLADTHTEAFTKREAFRALAGSFQRASDLDPVLELLSDHNYVRPINMDERAGPGRKPSQRYDVNPALHGPQSAQAAQGTWALAYPVIPVSREPENGFVPTLESEGLADIVDAPAVPAVLENGVPAGFVPSAVAQDMIERLRLLKEQGERHAS